MALIDYVRGRYRVIADFDDHGTHETIGMYPKKSEAAAVARRHCDRHGEPCLVQDDFTGRTFKVMPRKEATR